MKTLVLTIWTSGLPSLRSHVQLLGMQGISSQELVKILKQDFSARRKIRPQLSLREYSRRLGMDQSLLTKIFAGKRPLSLRAQQTVAAFLKLPSAPIEEPVAYEALEKDEFELLSDWVNFALLEYFKIDPHFSTAEDLAEILGCEKTRVAEAMQLLKKLGYIKVQAGRVKLLKPDNSWFQSDSTQLAQRLYQKSIAELSGIAIDEVPFAKRDHSSLTVGLDPELLPALRVLLKKFRRELDTFVTKNSRGRKAVYQLHIGLFPAFPHKENS